MLRFSEVRMVMLILSGCALAVSFSCFALLTIAQVTDPSEVFALEAVKKSVVDPMNHLVDWNEGDPCTSNWKGVTCFSVVGTDEFLHVKVLQLLNMNLSGNLTPDLGRLSHLQILDFMWNDLTGSIPKEIGSIASLRLLLLNGNKLSGPLPYELGYLSNLNRLQIDQNQISGPIPKSFSNLTNVKHLHLNNNSINGQIPPELSKLPKLVHLLLDNNNLSGFLPEKFSEIPELRILQLDNNDFSGTEIPASYGSLSKLVKISLRNCNLRGPVPDLSNIPNLSYMDLSRNQLTGPISTNKLSDNITTIDLSNNHLNGSIPGSLSNLPSLQKLLLNNNSLSGFITASIWKDKSFSSNARLILDFRNNLLSSISGLLNPPSNVTLRLLGNPVCTNENSKNMGQYCGFEVGEDEQNNATFSSATCLVQDCPTNNYFEYVPTSLLNCFCALPIRIGYRLKSPSFSYFHPYISIFETYVTSSLRLESYQLSIGSFSWEKGPRLHLNLKIFPMVGVQYAGIFNKSELLRIQEMFVYWEFPPNDFFGPYELLDFELVGPYSNVNPHPRNEGISKGTLLAIVLAAVVCAFTISAIATFYITKRHAFHHKLSRNHISSKATIKIDGVKSFNFKDLALATNNFNILNQVGQGGYGKVYKGVLSNNVTVAIKRAIEGSLQGRKEFFTEIELLSRLHHRNLVSLVGYCGEEGEQMLVYEFMPNGTLRDWLSAKFERTLEFALRLRIALGSAKGILYLHTEAQPPIFHRDIKASNILLDASFTAKVADFGLSRLVPLQNDEGAAPDHISTVVKGTPGYLDPEYLLTHKLTDKSDVYSLGVVFLEILTGMRPIFHGKNIVREVNLAHHSGIMFTVIDSKIGSYPSECVQRFVALALGCCQDKPEDRPSILDVVRELENILRMLPEAGFDSPEYKSRCFSESASSSSSQPYSNSNPLVSLNVSGSDLISGGAPTITPR